jgi:LysM repeat protein
VENEYGYEAGTEILIEQECLVEYEDNLESLASDFGASVEEILDANPGLDPNSVLPTQVRIPYRAARCPFGTLYTVRRGDSAFEIAREFNTSVGAIQQANPRVNLNRLRPGTVLCVPSRRRQIGPFGRTYIVRPGDTIFSIARRTDSSVGEILRLNPGLNPNRLFVGQQIRIPR